MPINPPIVIPDQVLPSGALPYVNQSTVGQVIGYSLSANPDYDSSHAYVELNSILRKIYDRRTWYGLMIRGQIPTSGYIQGGSVTVTNGSKSVPGVGTAWTPTVIGRQFRIGYNTPPYTVTALDEAAQVLTLEMPWAGSTVSPSGYFIAQYYYSFPNIKYIHTAKNLLQAWRLRLNYNQQSLDAIDPWRVNTFMPRALAQMPPGVNGEYMVELWPVPTIQQALPYIAVVQPPNVTQDGDSFPAYIRADIVQKFLRADALVYRGPKLNKYYDAQEAGRLRGEAEEELIMMAKTDEDLYRQNIVADWESMPLAPGLEDCINGGANYAFNHGVAAGPGTGGGW